MGYFQRCSGSRGHIFGFYDETQQGSIEFNNFGHSNNFWVKILSKNYKKREFWLKIGRLAHFEPLVLVEKNFLSLAAEWDLLGIWSGRKYVRTKEIVRQTQTPNTKIRISSTLPPSCLRNKFENFFKNSYRTIVLTNSQKEVPKFFTRCRKYKI